MFFKRLKSLKQSGYRNFLTSSEIIEDSHKRCRERKLDPCLTQLPGPVNGLLVEELIENSWPLLNAARPIIIGDLYRNFTDEDQIIILCNYEGYAIDLISSLKAIQLCINMGLCFGTCFKEEVCGTNAIALAMRLKRMVVIRGNQHYCRIFGDWYCIASPIRSPNGEVIGYLNISILSATGNADGDLVSTINILPSQTYYGDGYWGWPKNTVITQRVFSRNQYGHTMPLASRVGYNPNKQTFVNWRGFSSYLQPSEVIFAEEDDGNWSITINWDTVNDNVTAACEVLTKNTASDYNQWKWAHLANGENVQAWSAWQADGAPFNPFGPIVEFQSFYYWTPY